MVLFGGVNEDVTLPGMTGTARNCKVITTCFIGREVRDASEPAGTPTGWFAHAQHFPDPESVLELMALNYELECTVDPGAESDTIIVNNDVGWSRGNTYLASIDGAKTFAGHIRVLTRENYGRSFGGYNAAFEQFRHAYQYWTFTEDDILVNGDQYLRRCIERFERDANVGFVAIQGLSTTPVPHAHGGVGTTHVRVLDAVRTAWGSLPHRARHESQDLCEIVTFGEILFTHVISRLGYQLVTVDTGAPLYAFADDHMRRARGLPVKRRSRLFLRMLRRVATLASRWADHIE